VAASFFARCGSSPEQVGQKTVNEPDRPNILFILTDDQDVESAAYMPHLRAQIVDRGTKFDNAFVTDALCCPSRTSILRGQYPHNHLVQYNEEPYGGYELFSMLGHENSTVATWLHDSGYRTALFGKYLNEYGLQNESYTPPGWDNWFASMYPVKDQRYTDNGNVVTYDPNVHNETDVLSDKAVEYLQQTKDDPRPFFMFVAPHAPHEPAKPASRHKDTFESEPLPRPPNFNEKDVSDKPQYIQDRPRSRKKGIKEMENSYRNRLESLQAVDEMMDRIVGTLEAAGKLENTYVVFTSDNGYHLGQHRLLPGKNTAYEEDIRVPLVVRGPGIPAGQILSHLVINNDFAPTFAEIAGASVPEFVDGRSIKPLLGTTPPSVDEWRQGFMIESYQYRGDPSGVKTSFSVRTTSHIYVKYVDYVPGRLTTVNGELKYVGGELKSAKGERELYDLRQDPYELESQHQTADNKLVDSLESQWEALRSCAGAQCRAAEDQR
jgi:N-acetylglucosamine-6-sulfatase